MTPHGNALKRGPVRESVRANVRLMIERLPRKYKDSPDGQRAATAVE